MGTALTGSSVASTYDALLKITDNGPVGSTAKVVTDGLGNDSCFKLGTTSAEFTGGLTGTTLNLSGTLTGAAGSFTSVTASGEIVGGTGSSGTQIYVATATAGKSAARFEGVAGKLWVDLSGAGINYYDAGTHRFRTYAGGQMADLTSTGFDLTGEMRCDTFRIDAAPSASSATTTHKLAISCNGSTYYILLSNV